VKIFILLLFLFSFQLTCAKEFKGLEIQTVQEWREQAKDIPKEERKAPAPTDFEDPRVRALPDPILKVVRYNFPPGAIKPNLAKIKKEKQLSSQAVASSDCKKLVYVNYYFLPAANQLSSELLYIPLNPSINKAKAISSANIGVTTPQTLFSVGTDEVVQNLYNMVTIVDFSPNDKKLLFKVLIGTGCDGIWQTDTYVYDFETQRIVKFALLRDTIESYWLYSEGLFLRDYRWDITPLGFDKKNPEKIVFLAKAYSKDSRPKFLGAWTTKVDGTSISLLSLTETSFEISATGLTLKKEIDTHAIPRKQIRGLSRPIIKQKGLEKLEEKLEKRQEANEC